MTTTSQPDEQAVKRFLSSTETGNAFTAEQMYFLNAAVDHFTGGLRALEQRLYTNALQRFTDFLTTASDNLSMLGPATERLPERVAQAHFYAAVALLGGGAIGNRSPQVIAQVDNHLDRARSEGSSAEAFHLASVLWAIVKEDCAADGMFVRAPNPEELRQSLPQLTKENSAFLSAHIQQARGHTFEELHNQSGMVLPAASSPMAPQQTSTTDTARRKSVVNYFTRPPGTAEILWAVFGGFGLLICLFGLASGEAAGFLCSVVIGGPMAITALVKTMRYFLAYPKPSHQQMDEWLRADVDHTVLPRAVAQLRMDARPAHEGGDLVVPPQIVVGVATVGTVLNAHNTLAFYRIRFANDHQIRASYYYVLVLFMTDKIVSAYTAILETSTGHVLVDATQEHRYSDIAGVHTRSVPLNLSPEQRNQIGSEYLTRMSVEHQFSLNIVSGDNLTVTVGLADQASGSGGIAWSNERSLSMVQRMIRGKKEG